MVKYSGHTLISSLTPFCCVLKTHGRLSSSLFYGSSTKSTVYHYCKRSHLHAETIMVSLRYHPPWFSVAPMMDWTDNHFRTLARLISKRAWLYTEMIAAETIVFQKGDLNRFLAYGPEQHPIVLQIGGSNLENLAKATQLADPYGYDEINFNCGCPSPRVAGHGCFGVRLMLDPKFVAEAMSVIAANTDVPVSVKCRIGVDDRDSYNELCDFIYKVSSQSPTRHFIIHSRKALLNGLSPAENRKIPPLKYEYYYALLRDFPDLQFTINGGIQTIDEVNAARTEGAHGVMLGRAAYSNPWQTLGHVDSLVYGAPRSDLTRRQVLEQYQIYGDSVLGKYGQKPSVRDVVKPLLGLFHSEPGNALWKRNVDSAFQHCTTIKSLLEETLVAIPGFVLDSPVGVAPSGCTEAFANSKSLLPPPYITTEKEIIIESCHLSEELSNLLPSPTFTDQGQERLNRSCFGGRGFMDVLSLVKTHLEHHSGGEAAFLRQVQLLGVSGHRKLVQLIGFVRLLLKTSSLPFRGELQCGMSLKWWSRRGVESELQSVKI